MTFLSLTHGYLSSLSTVSRFANNLKWPTLMSSVLGSYNTCSLHMSWVISYCDCYCCCYCCFLCWLGLLLLFFCLLLLFPLSLLVLVSHAIDENDLRLLDDFLSSISSPSIMHVPMLNIYDQQVHVSLSLANQSAQ